MEGDNGRASNATEQAREEVGHVGESRPWNHRGVAGAVAGEEIRDIQGPHQRDNLVARGHDEASQRAVAESGRFEPASGGIY